MDADDHKNPDDFRQQLKQKATDELIQLALSADDSGDNAGWDAIWILRHRAMRDVFESARQLIASDDPHRRTVGVDILAQMGFPARTYLDETLDIFFRLIDTEHDAHVLSSVGVGLGHISPEQRKVAPLVRLKNHPDARVRVGVATGLQSEDDLLAIETLIELSADSDADVRDYATFGLGTQTAADTPEIRDALYRRAVDTQDSSDAPGEGLTGLAIRRDERAFPLILEHLESGQAGTLIFEAAENLAHPGLYAALVRLRDHPGYDEYERRRLEDAIAACSGDA